MDKSANRKLFGLGFQEDTMLTADIEEPDDSDLLNDETFGEGNIPDIEQWEIEDLSEQTENVEQSIRSQDEPFYSQYNNSADTLEEMVERSIVDLVAEDDYPIIGRTIPKSLQNENDFKNIFGSNSPQNPFLQFQQNQTNIWGSYNVGAGGAPATSAAAAALIEQQQRAMAAALRLNNQQNNSNSNNKQLFSTGVNNSSQQQDHTQQLLSKLYVSSMPQQKPPTLEQQHPAVAVAHDLPPTPLKNARTLEELEAELKAAQKTSTPKQHSTTTVQQHNFDETSGVLPPPTLVDLGALLNQQHQQVVTAAGAGAAAAHVADNGNMSAAPTPINNVQNMPRVPPVVGANMAPFWSHVMMNPQIRAIVLACMAAGKPIPPGLLPPPPPPFFRMPFMPPARMPPMPNQNFPVDMKSNANRSPSSMQQQQQQHMHRSGHFMNRRHHQQFDQRGYMPMMQNRGGMNRDPYAGLMSRREREWLVKIQTLQVQCENPYTDDYYFTMYNQKKSAESKKFNKTQSVSSDSGDTISQKNNEDGIEHRHYVPPTFEGSLGKVQMSSVNCPRQLIDVIAASSMPASVNNNSVQSPSSFSSSPLLNAKNVSRSKKLTTLLLEIENCYKLILECEEIYFTQIKTAALPGIGQPRRDKNREIVDKIATNCQKCYFTICANNEKLTTVLNSRKGRRLIGMMSQYLKIDDLIVLIQNVLSILPTLSRKETINEIYATLVAGLRQSFDVDLYVEDRDWTKVFSNFDIHQLSTLLTTKLGYALLLTLVYYCSKEKTVLSDDGIKLFINRFASTAAANDPCLLAGDKEMAWFGRTELSFVISWLAEIGVDQFVVNKCENQWRNIMH